MFTSVIFIKLVITWFFSALFLNIGIYLLGKIMGWRGDTGFWSAFPTALLVTAVLTLIDWGLGFLHIPLFGGIAKMVIWLIVIMKAFEMEFFEALLLAVILFIANLFLITFIISGIFSLTGH